MSVMAEVNCLDHNGVNGSEYDLDRKGLSENTKRLVQEWLELDKDPETRKVIERLCKEGKEDELDCRLGSRMTFGTAGLRAKMGAGYSMMNALTIIQTTQGLASYLLECFSATDCSTRGVAIGYDARHNSLKFAQLSTCIFLNKGFKVHLFSQNVPTPFVPFAVKTFSCVAGIQVTASHNPKEYNGYKVYWDNGAQIIPPLDVGISTHISRNLTPWETSWDTDIVHTDPRINDPLKTVQEGYFKEIQKYCTRRDANPTIGLKYVFTPLHGVGGEPVKQALRVFNLPEAVTVVEQMIPDPEFPTVVFPNPEEGKSALDLAIQTADANGCTLILATDPDADRLALAEKHSVTGEWKIFSGNELGCVLSWWAFKNFKDSHPNFDGTKVHMLASTVSSKFIRSLAKREGFQFQETLTGFKWMGNKAYDLLQKGEEVLFAYEEAIGFMVGTTVLDKDGISAAAIVAEYGGWLYSQGLTFRDQLDNMYKRYGLFLSEVSYFLCYNKKTIETIFSSLRNNGSYPTMCGPNKVVSVIDLTVGYDSRTPPDYKPSLPVDSNSQLITFMLDNNCICTLRTSGTEPKIKYYVEMSAEPESGVHESDLRSALNETVHCIVKNFLKPDVHGLIPRPT